MKKEIWLAGYPSFLGGADSEADHNIDLWRANDVEVNLVPMFGQDPTMRALCDARGCITHEYRPDIFKDKIVVSFCNGEFLAKLPDIYTHGKPAKVIWGNCMTWLFDAEIAAQRQGMITHHLYVSKFQRGFIKETLTQKSGVPVHEMEGYRPYFNLQNRSQQINFQYRTPDEWFALGRISRDDGNKFSDDMWNIFYKVNTPKRKKVFVLGFGPNAERKVGPSPGALHPGAPELRNVINHQDPSVRQAFHEAMRLSGKWVQGLDWQIWQPNEIPVKQVYSILHCIIHKTGGSRESYCRIVPEAMAYGVPLVVENDYAFPELIENGVHGYLCNSSDEMSYRASELAFDEEKRKNMIFNARAHLESEISSITRCWEPWRKLLEE